jgi:hypothetical protein
MQPHCLVIRSAGEVGLLLLGGVHLRLREGTRGAAARTGAATAATT